MLSLKSKFVHFISIDTSVSFSPILADRKMTVQCIDLVYGSKINKFVTFIYQVL